jgi:hypothetical protein
MRRRAFVAAAVVFVVAGVLAAPALAASPEPGATDSPPGSVGSGSVARQVGLSVTNVTAGLVAGGNVSGPATGLTGRVGVAGRVAGDALLVLDRRDVEGSATLAGAVRSGVADVTDSGAARVRFEGTVRVLDRERTLAWNWSYGDAVGGAVARFSPGDATGATGPGRPTVALAATLFRSPWPVVAVPAPAQAAGGGLLSVSLWDLYGFGVNLLLGLVLLAVVPSFSRRVTNEVVDDPVRTGAFGVGVLVAVPLLLLLFALSLFGLPLALAGAVSFAVLAWVGAVYVRVAVGTWLLAAVPRAISRFGGEYPPVENRWAGLFVGAVVVAVLLAVPVLGRLVDLVVLGLGLGALARLAGRTYRRTERPRDAGASEPTVGADE